MASICMNCVYWTTFICVALFLSFVTPAMGTQYNVGDSAGWGLSGVDYSTWAGRYQYKVGDSLFFQYAAGSHSVLQVSQPDFQTCTTTNPISSDNSAGNTVVTLASPGTYYFICGFPGHCGQGMKFGISVNPSNGINPSSPNIIYSNQGSLPSPNDALATGAAVVVAYVLLAVG
eukprot:c15050_g2_i1 orf=228-749(+)